MLILFDIDGTLLVSDRVGSRCMHDAARELFGEALAIDGVEIAGRIDPLIWADLARSNGIENHETHHERFRAVYASHLARRIENDNPVTLLPGVAPLLEELGRIDEVSLGILTGNYPETGTLKIEAAGLDPAIFSVAAWGSDGRSRRDLPAVALRRHAERTGSALEPGRVVVIGDTPHDVDCARAHGCRCLAVATGPFSREKLLEFEPDLVVEDLSETGEIVGWILQSTEAGAGRP